MNATAKKARLERVIVFPDGTEHNQRALEEYVERHYLPKERKDLVERLLKMVSKCEREQLLEWAEATSGTPHELCYPLMLALVRTIICVYRGNCVEYVLQKIATRGTCRGILLPG